MFAFWNLARVLSFSGEVVGVGLGYRVCLLLSVSTGSTFCQTQDLLLVSRVSSLGSVNVHGLYCLPVLVQPAVRSGLCLGKACGTQGVCVTGIGRGKTPTAERTTCTYRHGWQGQHPYSRAYNMRIQTQLLYTKVKASCKVPQPPFSNRTIGWALLRYGSHIYVD